MGVDTAFAKATADNHWVLMPVEIELELDTFGLSIKQQTGTLRLRASC